ncbi:MAG: Branched-chain phosphotransacylase [Firmicutes bacterium]|nr:Branched-chain phosphotransacylase [Bacillota bacterium]
MIKKFDELIQKAKQQRTMRLAVAAAEDDEVLKAVDGALELGLVEPILVGNKKEIAELAKSLDIDITRFEVIDQPDFEGSAREAVSLVSSGKADFVMKGILGTADLLKAVLDKEIGLRGKNLLSHVMVYEIPAYHKLIYLTDGGMNIAPDLDDKKQIIENAIEVCRAMGLEKPKIAALTAVEKVNPKMQATLDAAQLKEMCERGEFGDAIIDGPLSFDLAVSAEAGRHKGIQSPVCGDVDVILVPTIEVGNGVGKCMTYFANAKSAGIVMGAAAPVVLVSRADTHEAKLYSIALGSVIAGNK